LYSLESKFSEYGSEHYKPSELLVFTKSKRVCGGGFPMYRPLLGRSEACRSISLPKWHTKKRYREQNDKKGMILFPFPDGVDPELVDLVLGGLARGHQQPLLPCLHVT
jgi:hypothetical protein